MRIKFDQFLNESISRLQCNVDKDQVDSSEQEIRSKADDLELDITISRTTGTSMITLLIRVKGDIDPISEFRNWLKNEF